MKINLKKLAKKKRKTDKGKKREIVLEECISRLKSKKRIVCEMTTLKEMKPRKQIVDHTVGIDEELKCSHCGNTVIECMGKCETTLFKAKEIKEKNESFWSKFKKIINIRP